MKLVTRNPISVSLQAEIFLQERKCELRFAFQTHVYFHSY